MGTVYVDKLDPQSGTALEIGTSGDTITVPSGATFNVAGTLQTGGSALVTGKILQVVTGVSSVAATTTSNSFIQKATPTVSITPSSSSNKIYLSGHIYCACSSNYIMVTFGRVISGGATTTNISGETYGMGMQNVSRESSIAFSYLDSPSTTSAISYYFYFKNDNGSTSVQLGHNSIGASITAMEVSV